MPPLISSPTTTAIHELTIPFVASTINQLFSMHWRKRGRVKGREMQAIVYAVALAGIPRAEGKRRVSIRITLAKGKRRFDSDNVWKVILDALTHAGALVDDSPRWIEKAEPEYERGEASRTVITLEDLY